MPIRETVPPPSNMVQWRAPATSVADIRSAHGLLGRGLRDADLRVVASARSLCYLDLAGSSLSDAGLEHLRALRELRFLCLAGCDQISDGGLPSIGALTQLEVLDLSYCHQISSIGIEALRELHRLRAINLDACYEVTDAGLSTISKLPRLKEVSIRSCEGVSNEGLAELAQCSSMSAVELPEFASIDDVGIAALLQGTARITRIRIANLDNFTDQGMLTISISRIVELAVSHCPRLSDVGIEALGELFTLRRLTIEACPLVSQRAVDVLRRQLPAADIEMIR